MTRFLVSPSTSKKKRTKPHLYCISHPTIAGEGYMLSPRRLSPGTCLIQTHTQKKKKGISISARPLSLILDESRVFFLQENVIDCHRRSPFFWNLLIILLLLPLLLPSFPSAYFSLSTNSVLCTKGSGNLKVCVESKGKKKQVERENGGFVDLWMKKTRQIIKKIKLFRVYIPAKSQGLLRKSDNRKGNAHHVGGALKMRL